MKNKLNNGNESGVAIIIALGFLSLLLLMLIAFIQLSVIDRKISQNHKNIQTARLAAKTAYKRALIGVKEYINNPSGSLQDIYSYNSYEGDDADETASVVSDDLSELIATAVKGITNYSTYSATDGPHWQYLPVGHNASNPITARFAYFVIPGSGRLDPFATTDSGVNAQTAATSAISETDGTYTSIKNDGTSVQGRPGREVNEVSLTSLSSWFTSTHATNISRTNASPVGQVAVGKLTDTYANIFTSIGISGDTEEDSFKLIFDQGGNKVPEAFWVDNGDKYRSSEELYHRFDLTRSNWADIGVDSILSYGVSYSESTNSADIYSIPWINNWSDAGGFATAEAAKKQIAANIIDYNDSDSIATTDDSDAPTYVGLEKVPYINEVQIKLTGSVVEADAADPLFSTYEIDNQIEFVKVELVNMYDNATNDLKLEVTITGTYDWAPGEAGAGGEEVEISSVDITSGDFADIDVLATSYKVATSGAQIINPTTTLTSDLSKGLTRSINNFHITSLTVKLMDSSDNLLDYAYLLDDTNVSTYVISSDGTSESRYLNFQIADPRQNLLVSDWGGVYDDNTTEVGSLDTGDGDSGQNASDKYNANVISSVGDPEPPINYGAGDVTPKPWDISTAYIRNAPMQSPWELGFIHRAKAWQTINLKKYNYLEENTGGGGEYSTGDANILNQIKMTDAMFTYGKININSNLDDVLTVLVQNINISDNSSISNLRLSQATPGVATGFAIDNTNALSMVSTMKSFNGSDAGEILLTRAELLRTTGTSMISKLTTDSITDNSNARSRDAVQEEFVGKLVNLLKAEAYNDFDVVVIAQSIKDIGFTGTMSLDGNDDGTPSDVTDPSLGTYDKDGDKILSTQKLLISLSWNPQDEVFEVSKFEFLN